MTETTPIAKLRRQILEAKGITLSKHTKKPKPIELPPDKFPKTGKMKYLELRYHLLIEEVIFTMSLNSLVQKLGGEVDRATVSRWRQRVAEYLDKEEQDV